ncbi:MAG: tyrosine-type recombinase/integrase [Sciscionella sp.]
MAWAVLRPSGKYQGRYRNATGQIRSVGTYTQQARAVREAAAKEMEQRRPGAVDPKDGHTPYGVWFTQWHESRVLAYSTDEGYRSTAANHVLPTWEHVRLADITPLDVSTWVKQLRRSASPWTIRNSLMLLKTSLNAAVVAGRLSVNPARHVPMPDLPEGLERYLEPGEVEAICFYSSPGNALIVRTLVSTGLRFGELAGLHWHRVDLERGVIQVVEKFDQKQGVIDPVPKDKEQRTVPIGSGLVEMLDAARGETTATCGLRHVSGRCRSDLVFRGPRGAALRSNEWGRGPWRRALALAGITDRVRPHDCRHTFASWLIQEGVSFAELARVMGHSDWEISRRYAHLSDAGHDSVRDAITRRVSARVSNSPVTVDDGTAPEDTEHAV